MTEQKLKELLADMTLEEKVNQMSQVVGAFFNKDMDITAMGPMADKGFTPENVAQRISAICDRQRGCCSNSGAL